MRTNATHQGLLSTTAHKWSNYFDPYLLPLYKTALVQLKLTDDTLLLDVGCGSGLFSSMAIATGAMVTGIDTDPHLLEITSQRNPQNYFMEEELDTMPYADESFDVVTAFHLSNYSGDFEKALFDATRVLKTGECLVIGLWDKPEKSDAANVFKAISGLTPLVAGSTNPFALSGDGEIESIYRKNRLKMIRATRVACPFLYRSVGEGINSFMGTPMAAAAMSYTNKETVEEAIAKALQPFHITRDLYFLQNYFLVYILEK